MGVKKSLTFRKIERNEGWWLIALFAGPAWLVLWLWGHNHSEILFVSHSTSQLPATIGALSFFVFLGWVLMVLAMMLPTILPLLTLFSRVIRLRSNRFSLQFLLALGYLTIWSLFGLIFVSGYLGWHDMLEKPLGVNQYTWLVGPIMLIIAGLYQFTPIKYACLKKCRFPLSFIMRYWQRGREGVQAFRLGAAHGLFCLGCCWLLMVTMSLIGLSHLGWMLLFGIAMAMEKTLRRGQLASKSLGIILISWGVISATIGSTIG